MCVFVCVRVCLKLSKLNLDAKHNYMKLIEFGIYIHIYIYIYIFLCVCVKLSKLNLDAKQYNCLKLIEFGNKFMSNSAKEWDKIFKIEDIFTRIFSLLK